ncbi:MAG: hypothetical protein P4L73_16660 [Caulobacteraceae bacterium]|nr:hypothetical protein [Caulobacteraceae bacterium]
MSKDMVARAIAHLGPMGLLVPMILAVVILLAIDAFVKFETSKPSAAPIQRRPPD